MNKDSFTPATLDVNSFSPGTMKMHVQRSDQDQVAASRRTRVCCLVDGFNLYHALDWYASGNGEAERIKYRKYKWLSLTRLARSFIDSNSEELVSVQYFTAVPTWDVGKQMRHRIYIAAQEAEGVIVTRGAFRDKEVLCRSLCKRPFTIRVEKKTDVNIAIKLVDLAYQDEFDKALLISGDTDLIPAIQLVRSRFPEKEIVAILPIGKRALSAEVRQACNSDAKMTEQHLRDCQLPDVVIDQKTGVRVQRPVEYVALKEEFLPALAATADDPKN